MTQYVSPVVTSDTPLIWSRFVDDAGPLPVGGPEPSASRGASPARGDRAVRDDELPRLGDYPGDVRVIVTGGAGHVAGPAAYCRRTGLELSALDLTLRDVDDPAGNARRIVAALDAALTAGDLLDDTIVHVRVAGEPTSSWLAALDVLAEAELVVAVPLDAGDPQPWIDAALDRELQISLIGGSIQDAVAGLRTAARLWGDESDLAAARRWVRCWLTTEADAALDHLQALT